MRDKMIRTGHTAESLKEVILSAVKKGTVTESQIEAAFEAEIDEDGVEYLLDICCDRDLENFAIDNGLATDGLDYEEIEEKQRRRDRAMARELNCRFR
jgi:hypothetical protein